MSQQLSARFPEGLTTAVQTVLQDFLAEARTVFGDDLAAAVLFGSAAEGRLRPASDVNLILTLKSFTAGHSALLSKPLSLARASIGLRVMFLLESEIPAALDCFAQKFADVLRRRYVLFGQDPFEGLKVKREAEILRTRQVLLNLTIRLRERYALGAPSPDQVMQAISDTIGPLRTCSAAILELEGSPPIAPKEAFARMVNSSGDEAMRYLPDYLSNLREGRIASDPKLATVVEHLLAFAGVMRQRVEKL